MMPEQAREKRVESEVVLGDTVVTDESRTRVPSASKPVPDRVSSLDEGYDVEQMGSTSENTKPRKSAADAKSDVTTSRVESEEVQPIPPETPPSSALALPMSDSTASPDMVALAEQSKRSDRKVIQIAICAQRRGRGSSLGTCSKGSELEGQIGLPLNVFKYEQHISLPEEIVMKNAYLSSKLRPPLSPADDRDGVAVPASLSSGKSADTSSNSRPNANRGKHQDSLALQKSQMILHNYHLRIRVTSPAMVKAFALACQELLFGNISRSTVVQSDQLHLYSAASEIGVPRLQALCESVISTQLNPRRFVASVRIAVRHGRDPMVRLCYYWFKTQGAADFETAKRRASMTATERAVESVVSTDALPRSLLYLHNENKRELSAGGAHRFPIDVFASVLEDEHFRKAPLFRPPKEELASNTEIEPQSENSDENADKEGSNIVEEPKAVSNPAEEESNQRQKVDDDAPKSAESTNNVEEAEVDFISDTNLGSLALAKGNENVKKALSAKGFEGLRKCHVVRNRHQGPDRDQTLYSVFSEKDGAFIVAAMSTTGKTFEFSLDPDNFSPNSPSYVGRMDCSFTGTTFTLYDYGIEPDKLTPSNCGPLEAAGIGMVEHAVVIYDTNVLGRIPNAMTVHIPHIQNSGVSTDAPVHKSQAAKPGVLASITSSSENFTRLRTRKPIWSEELEAWTMDFHGRVKLASKKNFLLVSENSPLEVLMLFGKVSKSHFSLDYKAPLSVMQAFCVALTSFADKLMVT